MRSGNRKPGTYPLPTEAVDDIHEIQVLGQHFILVDQVDGVVLWTDAELGAQKFFQVTNPNAGRTLQILNLWHVLRVDFGHSLEFSWVIFKG